MTSKTPDAIIAAIMAYAKVSGLTFVENLGLETSPDSALANIAANLETIHAMGADLQKVHAIQHMLHDLGTDLAADPEKLAALAGADLKGIGAAINQAANHAVETGDLMRVNMVRADDPRLTGRDDDETEERAPSIGFAPWSKKPTHGGNNSRN